MDPVRIVINSEPRSAHAWLQFILYHYKGYDENISIGEVNRKNFIIRANSPVFLLSKFEDVKQTVILRNPYDIIPSIVTKTMGGIGNTITSNIPMPHEHNVPDLKTLIFDQAEVYERYMYGIENNFENLYPFTFEQVTQDISLVVKKLIDVDVSNSDIEELIKLAKDRIIIHNKGHIGYNNAVPVETKPDVYYEAKEMVNSFTIFKNLHSKYLSCRDLILRNT